MKLTFNNSLKKSLKIPKGGNQNCVNRRITDSTMAKRKRTKGQTTIYKTYKGVIEAVTQRRIDNATDKDNDIQ